MRLLPALLCFGLFGMAASQAPAGGWNPYVKAGSTEHLVAGSEIIHLVGHGGWLYAGMSYWMPPRPSEGRYSSIDFDGIHPNQD